MARRLTTKRRRFVEEYCVDFNGTRAYKDAGYKAKTDNVAAVEASRLLRDPKVRAAIDERLDELSMSAAEATKRLADWGRGTFAPFLTDDGGLDLTSPEARKHIGLLRKVKVKERMIAAGEDDPPILERKTEVELHDAKDAVKEITKIRGLHGEESGEGGERVIRVVLTHEGAKRGDD